MSASSRDTIPVHTWGFNASGNAGDFARVVPQSPLARQEFSKIVQRLLDDPTWMQHPRKYVHHEEYPGGESESEATDDEEGPRNQLKWYGYYRLNMNILPHRPGVGWVMGTSRKDLHEGDVDILLAATYGQFGVGGRHCRIWRNLQTSVLMISTQHSITIDGTYMPGSSSRVIWKDTGILIRDLNYRLEFTEFEASLTNIPQLLTPTPSSISGTYLSGDYNSSGRCWGYLLNCLLRRTCRNRQRFCGKEDEEAQGKLRPQQTKKTCTNANKAKADTATPFTISYALTKIQSLEALFIRYNDVSLKLGGTSYAGQARPNHGVYSYIDLPIRGGETKSLRLSSRCSLSFETTSHCVALGTLSREYLGVIGVIMLVAGTYFRRA